MTAFVHGLIGPHIAKPERRRGVRWAKLATAVAVGLAAGAGHVLRVAAAASRFLPGLGAGAAFVTGGFMLAPWVGWVVLGAVLLAVDRRIAT